MYDVNKDGTLSEEEIKPHVDKMKRKLREQLTMAKRTHSGMCGVFSHWNGFAHSVALEIFSCFLR